MREHRLAPDPRKVAVVVVPAPHAVGEPGQVLVHARASRGEELLEVDLVGAVGLERQEVAGDRALELARRGAVLRLHDPVGDEGAEQRKRRASPASQGEVVGADGVVPRPGEQRDDGGEHERGRALKPHAPGRSREQRDECEEEQHLRDRAHEDQADTPAPSATARAALGFSTARASSQATSANAAANTASLESWWKSTTYPG